MKKVILVALLGLSVFCSCDLSGVKSESSINTDSLNLSFKRKIDSSVKAELTKKRIEDSIKNVTIGGAYIEVYRHDFENYEYSYAYLSKKWGKDIAKRLMKGQIWIGMRDAMIEGATGGGTPSAIRNTISNGVKCQTWIFEGSGGGVCVGCSGDEYNFSVVIKDHVVVSITE